MCFHSNTTPEVRVTLCMCYIRVLSSVIQCISQGQVNIQVQLLFVIFYMSMKKKLLKNSLKRLVLKKKDKISILSIMFSPFDV